ncbi:hypothetical protein X777_03492, partial [Ooceraea biroi]
ASKAREVPPRNKRIMRTRFDVFEYLISAARQSRLITERFTADQTVIRVELTKDHVGPRCNIQPQFLCPPRRRARRSANERKRARRERQAAERSSTRSGLSTLEFYTWRRSATRIERELRSERDTRKERKNERESESERESREKRFIRVEWNVEWSVGRLVGWSDGCLLAWLVGWLAGRPLLAWVGVCGSRV